MGWPPGEAMLFGTLVIVTGPTVIRPLLRNTRLRPGLATVLEAEGLLIDPIGAMVAAVAVQFVAAPGIESATAGAVETTGKLFFGTLAGGAAGLAMVGLLRFRRIVPEGFENLVALGGALVTFVLCEEVLKESGILAVTVAGMVVGNLEERVAQELSEFQEQLTLALIGLLFVLLAANVRMAHVIELGTGAWLTVAALALVVRPIGVALCTAGSTLNLRERLFLSWVAPRGVVAAAVASIAAAVLIDVGRADEAREIGALVFLTIAVTVLVQGGSAPIVARLLRVRAPGREAVVILGAEGLGFALAEVLGRSGRRVLFVDTNPGHCGRPRSAASPSSTATPSSPAPARGCASSRPGPPSARRRTPSSTCTSRRRRRRRACPTCTRRSTASRRRSASGWRRSAACTSCSTGRRTSSAGTCASATARPRP